MSKPFAVESTPPAITPTVFSLRVDGDGDVVVTATNGGVSKGIGYFNSVRGDFNRMYLPGPIAEALGLELDENGRIKVQN